MRTILVTAAIAFCLATPAKATVWSFNNIPLEGAQETPPNASPATGSVTATINDVTGRMNISGSFQNLEGDAGDSHLHCCVPPGEPGLILILLSTTSGTSGTFGGGDVLDNVHVQLILDGKSYINVHSAVYSQGEIRGQLVNPVAPTLAGDFNADGHVDAADYATWRMGKDQIYWDSDYDDWRTNFGQSAGGGNGFTTAAVPEPAIRIALALAALGLLAFRRRVR